MNSLGLPMPQPASPGPQPAPVEVRQKTASRAKDGAPQGQQPSRSKSFEKHLAERSGQRPAPKRNTSKNDRPTRETQSAPKREVSSSQSRNAKNGREDSASASARSQRPQKLSPKSEQSVAKKSLSKAETKTEGAEQPVKNEIPRSTRLRLRQLIGRGEQAMNSVPVLALLSGRLDKVVPDSIPSLVGSNRFLNDAFAVPNPHDFLQQPLALQSLLENLGVNQQVLERAEQTGLPLNMEVVPAQILNAIGIDHQRVEVEIGLLRDNLALSSGLAGYIERAHKVQGTKTQPQAGVGYIDPSATAPKLAKPASQAPMMQESLSPPTLYAGKAQPSRGAAGAGDGVDQPGQPVVVANTADGAVKLASVQQDAPENLRLVANYPQVGELPVDQNSQPGTVAKLSSEFDHLPQAQSFKANITSSVPSQQKPVFLQPDLNKTSLASELALGETEQQAPRAVATSYDPYEVFAQRFKLNADPQQAFQTRNVPSSEVDLGSVPKDPQVSLRAVPSELIGQIPEYQSAESVNQGISSQLRLAPTAINAGHQRSQSFVKAALPNETAPVLEQPVELDAQNLVPTKQKNFAVAPQTNEAVANPLQNKVELNTFAERIAADDAGWYQSGNAALAIEGGLDSQARDFGSDRQGDRGFSQERRSQDFSTQPRLVRNEGIAANSFTLGTTRAEPMGLPKLVQAQPTLTGAVNTVVHRAEMLVKDGGGSVRIDLGTPDLGSVELAIQLKDNDVELKVMTGNDRVKDALASGLGALKESLEGQELRLTNVEVGTKSQDSWHRSSENGQFQEQGQFAEESQQSFDDQGQWSSSEQRTVVRTHSAVPRTAERTHSGQIQVLA